MTARLTGFLVVVALQFAILGSVIGYKGYTVATGETVLLKVVPVDPRSLFQGDYVNLAFDISRLDRTDKQDGVPLYGGRKVYVELVRGDDGYWRLVGVHDKIEPVADGRVLLKGAVTSDAFAPPGDTTVRVEYGIEQVYVPERSGRAIETSRAELGLEVKVDRFGNGVARRIFIDGQPYDLRQRP
ncbi:MAG: GDYXXLXY domain-containing protein [Dehalococcoidia bacterium]